MKAISIIQPYATLIAIGAKRIETRSWSTKYRGPIAIHATQDFPLWARQLCGKKEFREVFGGGWVFRVGCILATANLSAVVTTETITNVSFVLPGMLPHEKAFGDYAPGRFAWILEDVKPLDTPIPAKGAQRIWEWENPES